MIFNAFIVYNIHTFACGVQLNVYFQFSNNFKKISLELCLCVQALCHGSLNYCPFFFLMVFSISFLLFRNQNVVLGFMVHLAILVLGLLIMLVMEI